MILSVLLWYIFLVFILLLLALLVTFIITTILVCIFDTKLGKQIEEGLKKLYGEKEECS